MNTVLGEIHTTPRTNAPSLVQLCIRKATDNLSHIRDVGDTDIHLLKDILAKCTPDQLLQIENASKDRDLSPVTAALWQQFYIRKFGVGSALYLIGLSQGSYVPVNWRQIYADKSKEWTVMVPTNAITGNRSATTPGCFKKVYETLVDLIKKVFETVVNLLQKLGGIVKYICANASGIAFNAMFAIVPFLIFGVYTLILVMAFIRSNYVVAAFMLLLDIFTIFFMFKYFKGLKFR